MPTTDHQSTTLLHLGSFGAGNLPTNVAAGTRAFVTDANATFTAGIGAVVANGGSNVVPVFFDGTNWRIG